PAPPVRASRRLPAGLAEAAAAVGAGWPELLIAGVAANLQSLTGSARQVFAMPVLARGGPVRRAPGIAVNIVPLVVQVDPRQSLAALVGAIQAELKITRKHQRLRFEELARLVPGGALFGPQINLKPYVSALTIGEATARIRNLATGPVDDLSLIATDLPGGELELTLDGHASRYDQAEVAQQLDRLVETLKACAAPGATGRPVAALPTITPAERLQVIAEFNATTHPVPRTTLTAGLRAQLAATPEAPAVSDADESIPYAELHARAEALAAVLRGAGAGPGQVVGLGLQRSVGLSVAVTAVLLAGAAYLPIDPELPTERLRYVIADAQPACVLTSERVAEQVPALAGAAVRIDGGGRVVHGPPPADGPADAPAPHDPAYVIYTSGSTGRPKGVMVEHDAIVNRLEWMQSLAPIGPGDTVLQKTPYGFDVSVWELTWPLLRGARIHLAEPGGHRDPAYLAELIQRESVTVLHFVPSMLDLFLDEPTARDCTGLRHVICSGEALPETTVARYHGVLPAPLHNLYGPTEAAIDVTAWTCSPGAPAGPIPIGRPIWNTRTYVLDDAGRPTPVGAPGELWLAGANLARGYVGRPELTAERFVVDPFHAEWVLATDPAAATGSGGAALVGTAGERTTGQAPRMYRTGDVARWRPDGAIDYLGRTDDQVKLRGLRIELGEIETVLAGHPLVARAAAAVDETGRAPRLVAYVVPAGLGAEPAADDLVAHAAERLPDYMVPVALAFVDDLPLSANGKLDRRRLPAIEDGLSSDEDDGVSGGRAPASPREQALGELFAEALGRAAVGADQSLFDLGGDSLLAARLASMIRTRLGVPLSLGALFAAPTPEALAARIDDGGDLAALEPLLTLRAGGERPPLFCIHPAGGVGWCYAGLARTIQDRPIYAIQAPGIRGEAMPATLVALAAGYADLVEAEQPEGICHVLGWSIGGVLAQAVVAELQARGRETGVLALLDAYPGEQWADREPPSPADTLLALLYMGGLDARDLHGDGPTLETVLGALEREGSALASLGPETFERMADTVLASSRLMREHRTAPARGDVLFFLAGAPRAEDWLDATAWEAHTSGTVAVTTLDCTHPEMPRRGPLDEIARVVAEALTASELATTA
ncbi:MAG: amino acid adenylation domain-containing protein, partial [Solirubrobacteraceae bacterium]|nr:amino acid adenylation domain-containing protein [Solirubrobacteraceae bacterium]